MKCMGMLMKCFKESELCWIYRAILNDNLLKLFLNSQLDNFNRIIEGTCGNGTFLGHAKKGHAINSHHQK